MQVDCAVKSRDQLGECPLWDERTGTLRGVDILAPSLWAFDYDGASGEPSNERVFVTTEAGFPDGSCVDADGCVWNAEYGGSRVVRYTPAGKIDRVVELPVRQPTCCCFGGPNLDVLYIT